MPGSDYTSLGWRITKLTIMAENRKIDKEHVIGAIELDKKIQQILRY